MAQAQNVESAILRYLEHTGPCVLDRLALTFPRFTWNQVFAAIDRLSRDGKLLIRHIGRLEYEASLGGRAPGLSESRENPPLHEPEKAGHLPAVRELP